MDDAARFFTDVTSRTFLGIPLLNWLAFLGLTAVLFGVAKALLAWGQARLERQARGTAFELDDYLLRITRKTWTVTLLALAVFLALSFVRLRSLRTVDGAPVWDASVEQSLRLLAVVVLFLQAGRWATSLIDEGLEHGFRFANLSESAARTAQGVVRFFALAVVWVTVAMLVLATVGVEVTPFLATLGVGGLAVGFALQKILSDLFCSVAIVLDRPFEVGDFIITGDYMGTVEEIGVKTTRVRGLGGEQIVFPNSDLIESRVRNYKRMYERRVVFSFGVLYNTPVETLERLGPLVREIVEGIDQARFDRAHFSAFGDSALNFEVVYYVLSPDYNLFMDIQQTINLELMRRLEAIDVGFAFPTRTVHLEGNIPALRSEVVESRTSPEAS